MLIALSIVLMLSFSLIKYEDFPYIYMKKSGNVNPVYHYTRNRSAREISPFHIFSPGDTLDDIAMMYNVSRLDIIRFNKITDMRMVRPGDRIFIPAGIKWLRKASTPSDIYQRQTKLPGIITIRSSLARGKLPLSVNFSTLFKFSDSLSPVWDFGTGGFSFSEYVHYTYVKAGEYAVVLSLANEKGEEIFSNTITITVEKVNIDSDEDVFLTADYVGEELDLSGRFFYKSGDLIVLDSEFKLIQNPVLLKRIDTDRFLTIAPGYSKISLASDTATYSFYLFVSPFPTQHSVEPEYYWYKTQFNTGMYGNCGPACVAMAVHWATGEKISVVKSREEIGLPIKSGAVSFHHMIKNFRFHKINSFFSIIDEFDDMKDLIDRGKIVIILFNTTYIQPVQGDETLVFTDRYYPDTTGHYIVIKGYSLDKKYFVVYDPIPGDWQTNSLRYTDGYSMIGRNRYFLTEQIFMSIKGRKVLVIERKNKELNK